MLFKNNSSTTPGNSSITKWSPNEGSVSIVKQNNNNKKTTGLKADQCLFTLNNCKESDTDKGVYCVTLYFTLQLPWQDSTPLSFFFLLNIIGGGAGGLQE